MSDMNIKAIDLDQALTCSHCHAHYGANNPEFKNILKLKSEDDFYDVECPNCKESFRVIMKIVTIPLYKE